MAHAITDDCIACGACASECPQEAIHEEGGKYVINVELCTDCGSCVDQCPMGTIIGEEKK
jgi:ferredoxin